MKRLSRHRLRLPFLALLAAFITAFAAASPGSAQFPSFPGFDPAPPPQPISAYLSVPRADGTAEEGRPFLHPHFYAAGANALEFEIAIRRDYDYSSRYSTPVERHRGGNCPWWNDDGACTAVTFEDDWSHVRITAYAPDADGDFNVAFGASHGIGPETGSFCETSSTVAIPGSVCVISKADWKTAQGATADADAVAPLKLVLATDAFRIPESAIRGGGLVGSQHGHRRFRAPDPRTAGPRRRAVALLLQGRRTPLLALLRRRDGR